ncbi:MAG: tRNA pseudouridine(55) synthase TruB [Firmicutes bacterium HGW-Firmicutes-16]|nr:MAG: tRNA pseudouridine(55) synthase TruB [Firmicutes bacterium HGW-Firmicutes-16]
MNGIILVDKPEGFTSFDVVAKLRGILHERRIGHSGTLDPMATGLLVVFVGRATRAVEFAESHEKEYIAALRPGIVTDTQDITGTVLETSEKTCSKYELLAVLPEFTGELMQTPPMYSAIKIGGKKLYEFARKGVEVERESRKVTIKKLELVGEENGDCILRIVCSKGTYIRTLVSDIGERLGTGATLSKLRRTAAGEYSIRDAHTLDEISELAQKGGLDTIFMPVDSIFEEYPCFTVTEAQLKRCLNGNSFEASLADGKYRAYDENGSFLMLGNVENGIMSTVKSFFEI